MKRESNFIVEWQLQLACYELSVFFVGWYICYVMRDEVRNSVGLRFLDVSVQYKHHKQMFTKMKWSSNSTVIPGISWDICESNHLSHIGSLETHKVSKTEISRIVFWTIC